ncbi:hypothetical protein ACJMK2_032426 [Sinanodonta woodiana]|uniref:Glycine-rich protein n=1 Tax=Sinanodonta woodiana TaxID=1069815 RepID=A0ABD3X1N3_SINWO
MLIVSLEVSQSFWMIIRKRFIHIYAIQINYKNQPVDRYKSTCYPIRLHCNCQSRDEVYSALSPHNQTRMKAVIILLACMVCAIVALPQNGYSGLSGYGGYSGGFPWGIGGAGFGGYAGFGGLWGGNGGWGQYPHIKPRRV